eukprot:TRINITY_DN1663_c0_g1_i3.p1 TRINITY_DN1663_c0_g1~~TRINITY_DN1663_c0_g1_i3.p1  ORF type:complete len:279 (+),score=51.13 TRINITY_DN1663_c0_g1_i3:126-962(+)
MAIQIRLNDRVQQKLSQRKQNEDELLRLRHECARLQDELLQLRRTTGRHESEALVREDELLDLRARTRAQESVLDDSSRRIDILQREVRVLTERLSHMNRSVEGHQALLEAEKEREAQLHENYTNSSGRLESARLELKQFADHYDRERFSWAKTNEESEEATKEVRSARQGLLRLKSILASRDKKLQVLSEEIQEMRRTQNAAMTAAKRAAKSAQLESMSLLNDEDECRAVNQSLAHTQELIRQANRSLEESEVRRRELTELLEARFAAKVNRGSRHN